MKIGNLFNRKRNNEDIVCSVCGEIHKEMPDIGSFAPYHWNDTFNNDPKSLLTEDLCIIEERDYFIRGVIQIPILKSEEYFGWGVWVSQKKENFEVYREKFNDDSIGPFFGWLSTKIDYYNTDTLYPGRVILKTSGWERSIGKIPLFFFQVPALFILPAFYM